MVYENWAIILANHGIVLGLLIFKVGATSSEQWEQFALSRRTWLKEKRKLSCKCALLVASFLSCKVIAFFESYSLSKNSDLPHLEHLDSLVLLMYLLATVWLYSERDFGSVFLLGLGSLMQILFYEIKSSASALLVLELTGVLLLLMHKVMESIEEKAEKSLDEANTLLKLQYSHMSSIMSTTTSGEQLLEHQILGYLGVYSLEELKSELMETIEGGGKPGRELTV